jgi:hypothetical protein
MRVVANLWRAAQERVAKILGGANILPAKLAYRSRPPKKAEEAA